MWSAFSAPLAWQHACSYSHIGENKLVPLHKSHKQQHNQCSYKRCSHLNEPEHVVRVELVLAVPGGQDVPLHLLAAIDGDAVLGMLVLAGLQIYQHLLCQLS